MWSANIDTSGVGRINTNAGNDHVVHEGDLDFISGGVKFPATSGHDHQHKQTDSENANDSNTTSRDGNTSPKNASISRKHGHSSQSTTTNPMTSDDLTTVGIVKGKGGSSVHLQPTTEELRRYKTPLNQLAARLINEKALSELPNPDSDVPFEDRSPFGRPNIPFDFSADIQDDSNQYGGTLQKLNGTLRQNVLWRRQVEADLVAECCRAVDGVKSAGMDGWRTLMGDGRGEGFAAGGGSPKAIGSPISRNNGSFSPGSRSPGNSPLSSSPHSSSKISPHNVQQRTLNVPTAVERMLNPVRGYDLVNFQNSEDFGEDPEIMTGKKRESKDSQNTETTDLLLSQSTQADSNPESDSQESTSSSKSKSYKFDFYADFDTPNILHNHRQLIHNQLIQLVLETPLEGNHFMLLLDEAFCETFLEFPGLRASVKKIRELILMGGRASRVTLPTECYTLRDGGRHGTDNVIEAYSRLLKRTSGPGTQDTQVRVKEGLEGKLNGTPNADRMSLIATEHLGLLDIALSGGDAMLPLVVLLIRAGLNPWWGIRKLVLQQVGQGGSKAGENASQSGVNGSPDTSPSGGANASSPTTSPTSAGASGSPNQSNFQKSQASPNRRAAAMSNSIIIDSTSSRKLTLHTCVQNDAPLTLLFLMGLAMRVAADDKINVKKMHKKSHEQQLEHMKSQREKMFHTIFAFRDRHSEGGIHMQEFMLEAEIEAHGKKRKKDTGIHMQDLIYWKLRLRSMVL
jgi:hypothetical protein